MPPIETLINISLSLTHQYTTYQVTVPSQTHSCTKKFFCKAVKQKQRQNSKGTRHCQRDQEGTKRRKPKRQSKGESRKRAKSEQKESKKRDQSQKERAKERAKSPKRVASKDQQGEVSDPSFEGVCLSAGKVPNQD